MQLKQRVAHLFVTPALMRDVVLLVFRKVSKNSIYTAVEQEHEIRMLKGMVKLNYRTDPLVKFLQVDSRFSNEEQVTQSQSAETPHPQLEPRAGVVLRKRNGEALEGSEQAPSPLPRPSRDTPGEGRLREGAQRSGKWIVVEEVNSQQSTVRDEVLFTPKSGMSDDRIFVKSDASRA